MTFLNGAGAEGNGSDGGIFPEDHKVPFHELQKLRDAEIEPKQTFRFWESRPVPSAIKIARLTSSTDDPASADYLPDYPDDTGTRVEIDELISFASLRDEPIAEVSPESGGEQLAIRQFIDSAQPSNGRGYRLDGVPLFRRLFERPLVGTHPRWSSMSREATPDLSLVLTGRKLACYVENAAPGAAHRRALLGLLGESAASPPVTEWISATLDIAIYSAVLAAWHYKWIASQTRGGFCNDGMQRGRVSLRPRPREFDPRINALFDLDADMEDVRGARQGTADGSSPGTSRHPSYPSGHSTYGGAASELLSYFFPKRRVEFDRLADATGMARLWAGLNYRSDHVNGLRLGRAVARLLIEDIEAAPNTRPRA